MSLNGHADDRTSARGSHRLVQTGLRRCSTPTAPASTESTDAGVDRKASAPRTRSRWRRLQARGCLLCPTRRGRTHQRKTRLSKPVTHPAERPLHAAHGTSHWKPASRDTGRGRGRVHAHAALRAEPDHAANSSVVSMSGRPYTTFRTLNVRGFAAANASPSSRVTNTWWKVRRPSPNVSGEPMRSVGPCSAPGC